MKTLNPILGFVSLIVLSFISLAQIGFFRQELIEELEEEESKRKLISQETTYNQSSERTL